MLLLPDDFAYHKDASPDTKQLRARQNVILELGFFLGKIGRERVMILHREDQNFEMPTDYEGVLYIPFNMAGSWRLRLVQELKACGYDVDANKLFN